MIPFLLLTVELGLLYFLSRWLTQSVYTFFLLICKVRSIAVSLVTLLLFPGTVIHELSHLFVAEILGVRTGKLTLAPEEIRDMNIKAGSVTIAATDPIRRALIGIAPVITGIASLAALSYWLSSRSSFYELIAMNYLLFAISNSMFSSKQDLKGFWPVAIILTLIVAAGFFAGLRIGLTGQAEALSRILAQVLAINGVLLLTVSVLIAILASRR